MVGGHLRGALVVDADAELIGQRIPDRSDRHVQPAEGVLLIGTESQRQDDHPVHAPAQRHPCEELVLGALIGHGEQQQIQRRLMQHPLDAAEHLTEEPRSDVGRDHCDRACPTTGQPGGKRCDDVVQLRGHVQNALPSGCGHVGQVA